MRYTNNRLRLLAGLTLAGLVLTVDIVDAQGGKTPVPAPVPVKFADSKILQSVKSGKAKPEEAKEAMRSLAKFWAYNLAYYPYDGSPTNIDGKPRPANADDASQHIDTFMKNQFIIPAKLLSDQANYLKEVSKAMDPELKLVFEKDPRLNVKVNAVRFMSEIAKGPNPELVKTLLGIINEKLYNEAYKDYAYQGLRNLLSQNDSFDNTKPLISDPKALAEISLSLEAVVLGKDNRWASYPPEVVQFVRRNAIAALGAVPNSTIRIRRDEILARPALALVRIMTADDSIRPAPSINERLEAMLGLCNMILDESINLDTLAYGVNNLMLDLVTVQGEQSASKVVTIPWKATGARLQVVLKGWKKDGRVGKSLKNDQQPAFVWDLAGHLSPIAEAFESIGVDAKPDVGALSQWQQSKKPADPKLYKDDPTSVIKFAN